MKLLITVLPFVYRLGLRLYPRAFRRQFESEMRLVFDQAMAAAVARGHVAILLLGYREIVGLPRCLLRQHWLARGTRPPVIQGRAQESAMIQGTDPISPPSPQPEPASPSRRPAAWRDALLAAMPHCLVALLFGVLGALGATAGQNSSLQSIADTGTAIAGIGFAVLTTMMLVWAARLKWPRWAASWYFYGLAIILGLILLVVQSVTPPWERWTEGYRAIVVPLVVVFVLFWLAQRDRIQALLIALPLMTVLWYPTLEFVPTPIRLPLTTGTWLLAGVLAGAIVRAGDWRLGTWSAFGFDLGVGLLYAYARTYLKILPASAPLHWLESPDLMDFLDTFMPAFVVGALLLVGPLIIQALNGSTGPQLGRARTAARTGYWLFVFSLSLCLASTLTAFWWMQRMWPGFGATPMSAAAYGGLLLGGAAMAIIVLVLYSERSGERFSRRATTGVLLLGLMLLALPLVLALGMSFGWSSLPASMTLGFMQPHEHRLLVYTACLAWVLLGCWLVTRFSDDGDFNLRLRGAWRGIGSALLGAMPFIFFGAYTIAHELPGVPGIIPLSILALLYGLVLIGLAAAWLRGFPRWSFVFLGFLVAITGSGLVYRLRFLVDWSVPGLGPVSTPPSAGWPAWIPLVLILVLVIIVTRTLRPLKDLLSATARDWTRASFALYGTTHWFLWATLDENHHPYLVWGYAMIALAMAGGAYVYLILSTTRQRMLGLLAGLTVAWTTAAVINAGYWIGRQELWMREPVTARAATAPMILGWFVLLILFLAPWLPGELRRSMQWLRPG